MRGGDGKYDRDPDVAARDAEACRLRAQNLSYQQIADRLGIPKTAAYESVQRALADTVREPADEVRLLALMELDELAQAARQVLEARHYAISHGRLIRLTDDSEPLEDTAPKLAAVDRLLRIQESRRKLLGLDIPVKQELVVDGGIRYEIVGINPADLG